jgi:hypothetical protein
MRLSFKDWLHEADSFSNTPDGAGEIWDNNSNADRGFGRSGAKSKNVSKGVTPERADFDPDELYLGKQQKKGCKKK